MDDDQKPIKKSTKKHSKKKISSKRERFVIPLDYYRPNNTVIDPNLITLNIISNEDCSQLNMENVKRRREKEKLQKQSSKKTTKNRVENKETDKYKEFDSHERKIKDNFFQ